MNYRDDREALHHRVAQLEEELEAARREGEAHGREDAQARTAALEAKLATMRAEVEKMTAELSALRGGPPGGGASRRGRPLMAIVFGAAAISLLIVTIVFVVSRRAAAPPVIAITTVTPPTPVAPAATPTADDPLATAAPVPAPIPLAPIQAAVRETTARWTAKVTRADGVSFGAGATCIITATIKTEGSNNAVVPRLTVQCGDQALYRSTDALNGMSQSGNDAREILGATDTKGTFSLEYTDIGTRTGARSQVTLDTRRHEGSVFRETAPSFHVHLSIPTASTPGEPLATVEQRLRRAGKITRTTGSAPVKEGAACVLRAMPIGKGSDCVAEVTCGATTLFPQSAPVKCTYEAWRPVSVANADDATELGILYDGALIGVKGKGFTADLTPDEPPVP